MQTRLSKKKLNINTISISITLTFMQKTVVLDNFMFQINPTKFTSAISAGV